MDTIGRFVFFVLCIVVTNEAARILAVFPTPSISHQLVFRPLTQELAKRGHEIVVITTDPAFPKGKTPPNLTEIDVHDLSYEVWQNRIVKFASLYSKNRIKTPTNIGLLLISDIFEAQMQSAEVKKVLNNGNSSFDLLLLEGIATPALALSHVYKAPVIQVSSLGGMSFNYEAVGVPGHPLLYPTYLSQRLNNLTFWDKLKELYNYYSFQKAIYAFEKIENVKLKRNFGPDLPSLHELKKNINMLFLNIHPIWEGNFPVPPSVVYMGGLHQKPEEQLPNDLKSYLDSSTKGVVYVSFGTSFITSIFSEIKTKILINVFSQLPYDVLLKWDKDELPVKSKNIKIFKWLPQSDLLRHPKVKLFITQGGLQSTDESITAGVPLIGFPMVGDQWYNTEKYEQHKIGLKLDMETLSEEKLRNAINTVIEDESYRKNIVRLRDLMRDQPQPPLERAVWWTEYVLRHGGAKHLRAPAANITWAEYLELEFVSILFLGVLVTTTVLLVLLSFTWKFISKAKLKVD